MVAATLVSILRNNAWAWALRKKHACSMPGKAKSSTKRPEPVNSGTSSRRPIDRPTALAQDTAIARLRSAQRLVSITAWHHPIRASRYPELILGQ